MPPRADSRPARADRMRQGLARPTGGVRPVHKQDVIHEPATASASTDEAGQTRVGTELGLMTAAAAAFIASATSMLLLAPHHVTMTPKTDLGRRRQDLWLPVRIRRRPDNLPISDLPCEAATHVVARLVGALQ